MDVEINIESETIDSAISVETLKELKESKQFKIRKKSKKSKSRPTFQTMDVNVLEAMKKKRIKTTIERFLWPFLLIGILVISNALWGATIGITSFIDDYYGISPTSVRASAVNAVYPLFYFLSAPLWGCWSISKGMFFAFCLTLVGICIRIKWYIPDADVENGSTIENLEHVMSGVIGIVIANAFIASAQPFLYAIITTVTGDYIAPQFSATYMGSVQSMATLGYGFGFLITLKRIVSTDQFEKYFGIINQFFLAFALVLFVILIYVLVLQYKLENIFALEEEQNAKKVKNTRKQYAAMSMQHNENMKCANENKTIAYMAIFVYITLNTTYSLVSNYIENILEDANFSESDIFWLCVTYLIPVALFSTALGLFLDWSKSYVKITIVVLAIHIISQTLLFYTTNRNFMFFIVLVNGSTTNAAQSLFLSLICNLLLPKNTLKICNFMLSSSMLMTFVFMIISPIGAGLGVFKAAITIVSIVAYVFLCFAFWLKKPIQFFQPRC